MHPFKPSTVSNGRFGIFYMLSTIPCSFIVPYMNKYLFTNLFTSMYKYVKKIYTDHYFTILYKPSFIGHSPGKMNDDGDLLHYQDHKGISRHHLASTTHLV